ncbi:hypothetical protein ACHAWU_006004 [Discostella pseudostelligera]|uniref:HRDC domain-containing protein n=1 Tax=Discostella pseudostelligera TaxID=259834 RepID=A0ABD3MNE9_9STRA
MGDDATTTTTNDQPSLPNLLASLALGVRSVNALPLTNTPTANTKTTGGDDDDDDDEQDEFSFRMSLPEFASLNNEARQSLSSLLCEALEGLSSSSSDHVDDDTININNNISYEFDDPELWEQCADACDALYDRVSSYIADSEQRAVDGDGTGTHNNYTAIASAITTVAQRARANASGAYGRMIQGLADMEKPQNLYQGFVTQPPQNSRDLPFVPMIVYDERKQAKLEAGEYTREGHGLDTRCFDYSGNGGNNNNGGEGAEDEDEKKDVTRRKYLPDMTGPSYHYQHPYREEIEALEYRPWQLDVSDIRVKDSNQIAQDNKMDDGVWIGNEDDLAKLAMRIADGQESGEIQEIGLDLEAHSHRTFAGFVCLIQLSIRRPKSSSVAAGGESQQSTSSSNQPPNVSTGYDFLIDALALRHAIPIHLGPILVNPDIVKVMHGADSDIPWLQRDFGCYVVNLFDTGRASRALKFPSAGLAYLLRKYAGVEADKAHQLSDWRRRPLPEDMRRYAVSDTRYLLDIYDQLRLELEGHSSKDISIASVLDQSKRVCLIRYDKELFRPSGYMKIMDGGSNRRRNSSNKVTSELSSQQEATLKALYDWRDKTARQEDESITYVCGNTALLRIASNRPVTVAALQGLVNPLPPLVMRRSQEILEAIKVSSSTHDKTGGAVSTAEKPTVIQPAVPPRSSVNREMLSPILDSAALYQQAGWMTPTPAGANATDASESEADEGISKFLDVNAANQGYSSTQYTSHSIETAPPPLVNVPVAIDENDRIKERSSRGASTDGLGTTLAASGDASSQDDVTTAQRSATLIKKEMTKLTRTGTEVRFGNGFTLIDLLRPMSQSEYVDYDRDQDNDGPEGDEKPSNIDDTSGDNPEEDEMTIPKSMREIYNLSNANRRTGKEKASLKLLRLPGDNTKSNQPMKEDDIQEAEAILASRGGPGGYFGSSGTSKRPRSAPGKEGDIKLMIKMGWVKDKKDAESLAVVPGEQQQPTEKDNRHNHGSQHQKKSNAGGGKGGGGASGGSFDYYSSMGSGVGAFDPNAAPAKNPFFAGAAMSAVSMLHGESKGKSNKRNKKR